MKKPLPICRCGCRPQWVRACMLRFFLALGLFACSGTFIVATSNAQANPTVTLSLSGASLLDAFREIGRQTGYDFIYTHEMLDRAGKVSVNVDNADIAGTLGELLRTTPLTFRIEGETVVIRYRAEQQAPSSANSVTGHVTDKTGAPLVGVTVIPDGGARATASDQSGIYTITVLAATRQIRFSFIGMKTVHVAYTGQKTIDVVMEEEDTTIEEVVVTGIFDKPRESYTGAATLISAAELAKAGTGNLINMISVIDPSFFIAEDNVAGSDPNRENMDIRMRGSTSLFVGMREVQDDVRNLSASNLPLFILDGFEVSLRQVLDLDPSTVESVTLLKDASATALYGSRGANGIMVINKKKPRQGQIMITYRGNLNVSAPDLTSYNLLNAADKLDYEVAAGLYTSGSVEGQVSLDNLYSLRRAEVERGVDTYWLKYPVRVGVGQRHSLRLEGGDQSLIYAGSFSLDNTLGVMKGSKRNTLSGSINLQYTYKRLRIQDEIGVISNRAFNSPYGGFSTYATLNPYWKPYGDDGKLKQLLTTYPVKGIYPGNPLYDASLPYRDDTRYDQYYNNISVTWEPAAGLKASGNFRVMRSVGSSDRFISPLHSSFSAWMGSDYTRRGSYTYGTNSTNSYEGRIQINYNRTFADRHMLYAGFNFDFGQNKMESNMVKGEGYAPSKMVQLGLAAAYERNGSPSSSDAYTRRVGAVLTANYTYDNRYFLDVSGRMDGSSQFGTNKRMAPFWSVGAGWNVHREEFMEGIDDVSYLRLRSSYGTSGSQNFSAWQARTTFQYYKGISYHYWQGAYMMALGNPDLKWQTTGEFNGGLEFGLFNNSWRLTADYYIKRTHGVLMDIDIPTAGGFGNYKSNLGEVENRGFELTTVLFLLRNTQNRISWSVNGSVRQNSNRVLKISNAVEALNEALLTGSSTAGSPAFLVREGQSLNTMYAVKSLGIDPSTGQELFEKADGTHTFIWDTHDRVACGVTDPDLWGSFGTAFRYKGLSLNVALSYRTGGYIYNSTLVNKVENVDPYYNVDRRVYDSRWKEPGDQVLFKSVMLYNQNTNASTRFVMEEHSLDCRLINVAWEPDAEWVKRNLGLRFVSVGLSTENLFRISSVRQERGTSYPFARTFSMSLTARF